MNQIINYIVLLCGISWCGISESFSDRQQSYVPHYSDYFYGSLVEKLKESSLKSHQCISIIDAKKNIQVITPNIEDKAYWKRISNTRRFYRVSDSLCKTGQYRSYLSNISPLCPQPFKEDFVGGKGHFHPSHPRCQPTLAKSACTHNNAKMVQLPPLRYSFQAYPFIINITSLIHISSSGMLYTDCEVVGLFASCKASSTGLLTTLKERKHAFANTMAHDKCMSTLTFNTKAPSDVCPYAYHPSVFVASQYDDTQIGQVLQS